MARTMIPEELISFVESGLSTYVGTCSAQGRPMSLHGVGVLTRENGRLARVFLPTATSAKTLANLSENPRVAVTLSRPETHRTVQLKGSVLSVRSSEQYERPALEALYQGWAREAITLGVPPAIIERFTRWPAHTVEFEVEEVFIQTPGPLAGNCVARKSP